MLCSDCHWFDASKLGKELSNGKVYPCSNILRDGWDYWDKNQQPPHACSGYIKDDDYKPDGIWKEVADVMKKLNNVVEMRNCEKCIHHKAAKKKDGEEVIYGCESWNCNFEEKKGESEDTAQVSDDGTEGKDMQSV